jgi:ring-1,2-phenylacetyl-CoA epoxidase subunit PaaD
MVIEQMSREQGERVWKWLDEIADPEIPAISIVDLGIVRRVEWDDEGVLVVTLTPTYSGCPATELIRNQVVAALQRHGVDRVRVGTQLSPAWSTDWITERGRRLLYDYGITPPSSTIVARSFTEVICPHCGSEATTELSRFGSTPCKALYRCEECREPFDYFKPH